MKHIINLALRIGACVILFFTLGFAAWIIVVGAIISIYNFRAAYRIKLGMNTFVARNYVTKS